MMRFYFQKKVLFGFLLAFSIIAGLGIWSYVNNQKFKETSHWVSHTNEVLFHAERVVSVIIDIESGQRGYTITGDSAFLESYVAGQKLIHEHIADLHALTSDNPAQQKRIDSVNALVDSKLRFAADVIHARTHGTDAGEITATREGKLLMDTIRGVMQDFQEEERRLLARRSAMNDRDFARFSYTYSALLLATGLILILLFISIHRNLLAREATDQSLREALAQVQDMYNSAPCGYHALDSNGVIIEINQTWLDWLGYTREDVVGKMNARDILTPESREKFARVFPILKEKGSIADVEVDVMRKDKTIFPVILNATAVYDDKHRFVRSRSTVFDFTERKLAEDKVKRVNSELEAFTYSVSHDLRAPLRSIDGYARILSDDHSAQLDDEGKRILGTVIKNAHRMGKLIDDLLDFSRFGRKEITMANFNMEHLVRGIFMELLEGEHDRNIGYSIHNVASVPSDATLLRQVWLNLISNAFKYTRKKENAFVEISSQTLNNEVCYCIKDNGTGFDMQYAHKLFTVFQRLHKPQDFEGTGVGLAIVHRIVTRLGGKTWAEGKEKEGASFYFTLPLDKTL